MRKKRLIIADINSRETNGKLEGHCVAVAENYLTNFGELYDVLIAGGSIYKEYFPDNHFELPYTIVKNNSIVSKLKVFLNGIALLSRAKDSVIVFQQSAVTIALFSIILSFARRNNEVYLIQYNTEYFGCKFKRKLFDLAKKKICGIICSDQEIGNKSGLRYCSVPDFIYTGKKKLDDKKKDIDFGIYGYITAGKGVLEAVQELVKYPCSVKVAGKVGDQDIDIAQAEKIKEIKSDKFSCEFGYLSAEKYWEYMARTKYCVLNYQEVYANRGSGVILDCIYNGIPVVTKRREAVEYIQKYDMGIVYDDIRDVNFGEVLDDESYEQKKANIDRYLQNQHKYVQKLVSFFEEYSE